MGSETRVVAALLAVASIGVVTSASWGDVGTPPPFRCGTTYVFAKAIANANVPAGEASAVALETLHYLNQVEATFGNFCPSPNASVTMCVELLCTPPPSAEPLELGPFPIGEGFTSITVDVPIPAGPARTCDLVVTSTIVFSNGLQISQTADQRVCVVDPAPAPVASTLTRLDVVCLDVSGPLMHAHPGDQRSSVYRITNNDPDEGFQGLLTIDCRSVSGPPTVLAGQNDEQLGVYATGDPVGGAWVIGYADEVEGCLPLPARPHELVQPVIVRMVAIPPGNSVDVEVVLRTHRRSATGATCEGTAFVEGLYTDGTTASACSGYALAANEAIAARFECGDAGRVASAASDGVPGTGPSVRLDGDASRAANEPWRINFALEISSMDLLVDGQPITGGTPNFSGVTQIDGGYGRLLAEFSFITPTATPTAQLTMIYDVRVVPDDSSPNPVSTWLRSVAVLPDVPSNFDDVAPVIVGEVELADGIGPAYLQFVHQLSALGVEQGDFSSVAMTNRSVAVQQLSDIEYRVTSDWTATRPGQDPMIGFDVSNDFRGTAMDETLFQACCTPHLSCLDVHEGACVHMEGEPQGRTSTCSGGTTCPMVPCCFIVSGSFRTNCFVTTPEDCAAQGGIVSDAPDCETPLCPIPGACCFIPNSCEEVTFEANCEEAGGIFMGPESTCDHCGTLELGACCLPDGTCIDTNNITCSEMTGVFRGRGTICLGTECPTEGPCCFGDGTCITALPVLCVAQGGIPVVAGSCGETVCDQPVVCCDGEGRCASVSASACAAAGGTTFNDFADCTVQCEQAKACCLPNQLPCVEVHPDVCAAMGGFEVASCVAGACDEQACCLPGGACVEVSVEQCRQGGGVPGGPGTTCPGAAGGVAGDEHACPACTGDADPDGEVNVDDLILIILNWGCVSAPGACPGDIDVDGDVDVDDLVGVVLGWGTCGG